MSRNPRHWCNITFLITTFCVCARKLRKADCSKPSEIRNLALLPDNKKQHQNEITAVCDRGLLVETADRCEVPGRVTRRGLLVLPLSITMS